MPGKVGVKIKSGRNLPVMDRSSDTTDAYVEIKLGSVTHKTDVCRKSLNPQWNTEWFRFEVDDAELQDEPLQIRLMDYDTYSANDAIGKVNINLNPLCLETSGQATQSKGTVLTGWIPVFDTMHGIRGEVNIIVKVDLFSDLNKFRQSSCGIQFFHSQCIPHGYRAQIIHGFVEELVVNDDPEYQWIDKIRTPRASNEARQVVFNKLSGQVQRKIGIKAINMGANAVVGYMQCFDLEGDVGVVARGIGTAISLIKDNSSQPNTTDMLIEESLNEVSNAAATSEKGHKRDSPTLNSDVASATSANNSDAPFQSKLATSPSGNCTPSGVNTSSTQCENMTTSVLTSKDIAEICRRSSESDLTVTAKGNSIPVGGDRLIAATALMRLNQTSGLANKSATDSAMDMLECPFLTLTKYPAGFLLHLGATVAARSVKLLERVPNPDEPEIRDSWWTELRMEIRSHARSLGCNFVLGYSESTTISDDVCVLSATGTAAIIIMAYNPSVSQTEIFSKTCGTSVASSSVEDRDCALGANETIIASKESAFNACAANKKFGTGTLNNVRNSCSVCHVPYNSASIPFNVKLKKCALCKKGRVPDVLLATIEVPDYLQVTGRGCFMQAQVVRAKKDLRSELNAKEISDGLPFLEYELHRVLINKLKAKGMNAIFGLKAQVAIGERMIALIATGTALFLTALPVPQVPKIVAGNSWTDKQKLNELQKKLQDTFEHNQELYRLKCIDPDNPTAHSEMGNNERQSDTDESDEEPIEVDFNYGNKDTCVLEVDDIEDLEIISLLMEPNPPENFDVVNTHVVPGLAAMEATRNLQMFAQVWRAKLDVGPNVSGLQKHFQRLLQTIYFKLRTMIPCSICDLKFYLDLPDSDQIQLLVTGMVLRIADPTCKGKYRRKTVTNASNIKSEVVNANLKNNASTSHGFKRTIQDEENIFPVNEEETTAANLSQYGTHSLKLRKTSSISISKAPTTTKFIKTSFRNRYLQLHDRHGVDITPLTYIAGGKIEKYLGNLNFFFIRESTSIRENGGISGFVHGFITELLAVVRAHITALGGNAMVSFYMTELMLVDNQHKNQGQCLVSIGGDVVFVSYFKDDDM